MDLQHRLDRTLDAAIANNRIVGAVVQIARHGSTIYSRAAGLADREAGVPVAKDTIFRLASVTKPIVAATALAMVEASRIGLDDPVSHYLPYFTPRFDGETPAISIRNLLTHTAGLGYDYPAPHISAGLNNADLDFETNFTRVAALPLNYAPGTAWQYSIAIDVLGAVIAKVYGGTLGQAIADYVTGPLSMADTAFHAADPGRLAIAYADGATAPIRMNDAHPFTDAEGEVIPFAPARLFNPRAFQSGGAGMAGTAGDMLKFFECLRTGGQPILSSQTVADAMSNKIGNLPREDAGQRFGYFGAVLADPAAAASPQKPGTIAWGGIYGNSWFIDPALGLTVVAMTNTAPEGCTGDFPNLVRDAIYAAIAD